MSIEEEISRVVPVIESIIRATQEQEDSNNSNNKEDQPPPPPPPVTISIDTRQAAVARAAVAAGAHVVNDVSGGTFDSKMLSTVAELGVPLIMMHMR